MPSKTVFGIATARGSNALLNAAADLYGFSPDDLRRAIENTANAASAPVEELFHYYPHADSYAFRVRGVERRLPVVGITGLHVTAGHEQVRMADSTPVAMPASIPIDHLAACLAPLVRTGARLWDDTVYRLMDYRAAGSEIHINFALDRFLRCRLTSGLMREEARTGRHLLRDQIAPTLRALLAFASRLTAGGVHMLCAFRREQDYVIALQRRSSRVGEAAGSYGVIPMAFHQPVEGLDARPSNTALREVYEELFGGAEGSIGFRQHPAIEWILTHSDLVRFEMTSFWISMLSGNYDCGMLLAVEDPAFWRRFGPLLETCWESESHILLNSHDMERLNELLLAPDWEGQALATLVEGLRRLELGKHLLD